jgi:hypothetical protein
VIQLRRTAVSKLRKYRPLFTQPKKSRFSIDKTLLIGFVGLTGIGLAQPAFLSVAVNDTVPSPTMLAQSNSPRIGTDFTPVGSINAKPLAPKPAETKPREVRRLPGLDH